MRIKKDNIAISMVIPLLNEEGNIGVLYQALIPVLEALQRSFEIIFIDDGSSDGSLAAISQIASNDKRVLGISLSRNFGHQIALTAGIEHSSGDVVITMDGDMQHPVAVIPLLYNEYLKGYDIVNTIRTETAGTGAFKRASSSGFYRIMNRLSDVHIEPASADFRLMSRKTVDAFLQLREKDRFTRGLISWMGFSQGTISYTAPPRHSGKTKYSFTKMLRFAADGITSFSARPLRISFFAGLIVSFAGLLYAAFAICEYFAGKTIPGWTSILVTMLIIGGIQLISIGIIGEYLARVFNEAKNRPLYLVKHYTAATEEIATRIKNKI